MHGSYYEICMVETMVRADLRNHKIEVRAMQQRTYAASPRSEIPSKCEKGIEFKREQKDTL